MKPKQLRKARKFVTVATFAGIFGPDPDNIFYLIYTQEIRTARRLVNRHGFWLINNHRELFGSLAEIAAIQAPIFSKPDCNGEYWD